MQIKDKYKGKGLLPLPPDTRDFSHAQVFGSANLPELPDQYMSAPALEIKNQDVNYPSDFCTSYAAAACAEDEDGVVFVPEWTFAQAKGLLAKKIGEEAYASFGLNLRDICLAACAVGFLPRIYDPFKCDTPDRPARNDLGRPEFWPEDLVEKAANFKKASFFLVDGPYDVFDNFRSVLWQNATEKRSIITGCLWRLSWNNGGIVPEEYESEGFGHAIKICGWKTLQPEPGVAAEAYLVAQLSDGPEFGDHGYVYFPRSVVNKEFGIFGAYTFKDIPAELARGYQQPAAAQSKSFFRKVIELLCNLFKYHA